MFEVVQDFETQIASFFGAPFAVAVDSCTHGIELALRYSQAVEISVPKRTYLSIPFLAHKLGLDLVWRDDEWVDYYYLTDDIVDAAVLWKANSYIPDTMMGISFQYQKHLSLGRGGVLLLDDEQAAMDIKKMSYDGRLPNIPWRDQNISTTGFHYYMTPETAQLGIEKLDLAIAATPRRWVVTDWPDLTEMDVFGNGKKDG
jgi:dTDP-4-amino-4,6-dideoxygalactose transaminase